MGFISTGHTDLVIGSVWKHAAWTEKQIPDRSSENQDYTIERVLGGEVKFVPENGSRAHTYSDTKFLRDLVPLKDPHIKWKTQLFAALSPMRGCPELQEEYQKLLVELEI